jgi:general secretion pathway protein I
MKRLSSGHRPFAVGKRPAGRSALPVPSSFVGRSVRRSGLTLLEIVLATALFLGAISVMAQIVWSGQRAAVQARLRTEAVFRCETKLAELLAGAERFQSVQNVPFPDDSQWTWSAQIASGQFPELLMIVVTVRHRGKNPATNAEFSLERWARDPLLFLEAAQKQNQSKVTTSSSTSSSSASTTSASSGGSR